MTTHKKKHNFLFRIGDFIKEIVTIAIEEYRHILRDVGVIIIFFGASILYPLMYNGIYHNEVLRNVPVALVDLSQTTRSRELLRKIEATPELCIAYRCATMQEARNAFQRQEVHGIIYVPADYSDKINAQEQATVSMYADMSSFMYYRVMMSASSMVVQDVSAKIRYQRLNQEGIDGENAKISANPLPYTSNILYNSYGGFGSFLLPALMILIIHQTLFLGIGMEAGSRKEENKYHLLIPVNSKRSIFQIVMGKCIGYFSIYFLFSAFTLGFIPRFFNMPHIGDFMDIMTMMVPFLLATIFFSMTVSVFMTRRETVLVVFIFCSLILLFLTGFSWPPSNINGFWLAFSWIFPSSHGVQAYIKMNTMGADLKIINKEYVSLWVQAGFYFMTTLVVYRWQISNSFKKLKAAGNRPVTEEQAIL